MVSCRSYMICLLTLVVAILVATDICATIVPAILKPKCAMLLCLNHWLLSYGSISICFNYLRLADLFNLIDAYGDTVYVGLVHFLYRILFDIVLIIFHSAEAIIGIIILHTQIVPDNLDYDYTIMYSFITIVIISNIIWASLAMSFIYFKFKLLNLVNTTSNTTGITYSV
jgi:hypothetical protein